MNIYKDKYSLIFNVTIYRINYSLIFEVYL
jgi:hypothetical protein